MKKKWLLICGSILLGLGIIYGAGVLYYHNRFFKGTYIDGVLCENLTAKEAEKKMEKELKDYVIELQFKENKKECLKGSDVEYQYTAGGHTEEIQKKQNSFAWISHMGGKKTEHRSNRTRELNEEKLMQKLQNLEVMQEDKMKPSENAYIAFENNQFVIKDEVVGTKLEKEKMFSGIKEAMEKGEKTWSAEKEDVYQKPEVTREDAALKHQQQVWNSCAAVTVKYTFGAQTEVLDGMVVKEWMTYDEAGNYVEDPENLQQKIRAYVNALSEKYNTVGRSRTIISTATGQPVTVEGGSYGFLIDVKGESEQLLADIQAHADTTRQPVYARAGVAYEENDIGNTYVEIDLTSQHLWYYKDGSLLMDSALVSGTYYNYDRRTPSGTYYLYYKQKNQVLRPAPNPDGSYDYESPVDYWMPFNGGIGMHDANWRSRFGGSYYLYNGSHGCINLPVSFAGGFYNSIEPGCPIVCFYR